MYRDLPYYEGIRAKIHHEYKLHKNHANSSHTFRKWLEWSQFIVSGHSKCWLICHSMASTAIYSSHDCGTIKHGRPSLDSEENQSSFFIASYQVSLCCYSDYLTFLL